MKCCPHPDFDGKMCQTCFTKPKEKKITFPNGSVILLKDSSLVEEFRGIDQNCDGLIYARYGGYSEHHHLADSLRYSLLATGFEDGDRFLKRPVDGVWNRVRTPLCWLVVVVVAYFVARFVGQ